MTHAPIDDSSKPAAADAPAPWFVSFSLDFVTPQLARAAEVWRAKRGSRTMPARADLSLADLKFTLGNLCFLDIVKQGAQTRYRVRLQGSVLDEHVAPMTGQFIDEAVSPHFAEKWAGQWLPTIERRAPARAVARVEFLNRRWFVAETLYAPLADDGETPNILMIVAHYHAVDGADSNSASFAARLTDELNRNARVKS